MRNLLAIVLTAIGSSVFATTSPTIHTPANNATNVAPFTYVAVNHITGAVKLEYEFNTDAAFDAANADKVTAIVTSFSTATYNSVYSDYFSVDGLKFGKQYYLRMRAYDGSNVASAWSSTIAFTTAAAPNLHYPGDNTNVDPNLTVAVADVSGITKVEYEFDTDNTFANANGDKFVSTASGGSLSLGTFNNIYSRYFSVNGLKFGKTYFIRTRFYNVNNVASDWSNVRYVNSLSAPILHTPANGSTEHPSTTVAVNYIAGVSKIEYEFDTDINFGNANGDWMTASAYGNALYANNYNSVFSLYFSVNGLKFGKTYYLRTRAYNVNNAASGWSNIRTFSTINAPTIHTPANNSTVALGFTVAQNYVAGISKIEYEVDTDNGFANASGDKISGIASGGTLFSNTYNSIYSWYFDVSGLKFAKTYYLRTRFYNTNNDVSAWSNVRTVSTSMIPNVLSPSGSTVGPLFNVAVAYITGTIAKADYEIDTDSNFANSGGDKVSGTVSGSSIIYNGSTWKFDVNGLKWGKYYNLRVRLYDASGGVSNWSSVRTLAVISTPTITYPTDGASNYSRFSIFFKQVAGTSKVEAVFDTDQYFRNTNGDLSTMTIQAADLASGTDYSFVSDTLKFGTTYYYQIRLYNVNNVASNWSPTRSMRVYDNEIISMSPADGSISVATTVTLQWQGGGDSELQLCASNLFNAGVITRTTSTGSVSFQYNPLQPSTTYYWRVRSRIRVNGAYFYSSWAEKKFSTSSSINNTFPPVVTLVAPAYGAVQSSSAVTLDWQDLTSGTFDSYEYEYSPNAVFWPSYGGTTTSSQATLTNLQSSTNYYWRVRSIKSNLGSAWSTVRKFITTAKPVITWPNPADITYGTALSGTQLNATATYNGSDVAGTFTYSPSSGTVLNAGNGQALSLTFTPSSSNFETVSTSVSINVVKASQNITFSNDLSNKTFGAANITLTASSTSGLTVTFQSDNSSVATISGNTLTIKGAGTANISAKQAGNANYAAASDVVKILNVMKADPALTFADMSKAVNDGDFVLSAATSSDGALIFSDESQNGLITINNGSTVRLNGGTGSVSIKACVASTSNYNGDCKTATLTISNIVPTISFGNIDKVYGDPEFDLTASSNSLGAISYSILSGSGASVNSAGHVVISSAGSLVVQASQAANGNYGPGYASATITINKKTLSIQGLVADKIYDGTTSVTFTGGSLSGVVTNDAGNVSLYYGAGDFNDKNAGTNKSVTLTSNFAITGSASGNYSLTQPVVVGNILRKQVVINPRSGQSKEYGKSDPYLTFANTALLAGDNLTGQISRTSGMNVGEYDFILGTLTAGDNYEVKLDPNSPKFVINKKSITVTAVDDAKPYGAPEPSTYQFTTQPLLESGDGFQGTLKRDPGENVGAYTIRIGTLTAGNNYQLTFNEGFFTIQPKAINIYPIGSQKVYGSNDPALEYIVDPPLVAGDVLYGALSRQAGEDVGSYPISIGTLSSSANYVVTLKDQVFKIVKANAAIQLSSTGPYTYNGLARPVSVSTTPPGLAVNITYNGQQEAPTNAGTYSVLATVTGSANYAGSATASLTINKASQTINFPPVDTKKIGDPPFTLSATASSGLPVAYTLTPAARATNVNSVVTIISPGRLTMTASQAGNQNFTAASETQSICITPAKPSIVANTSGIFPVLTSSSATGNQWYRNGQPISNAQNSVYNVSAAGVYTVRVTIDDCLSAFSDDYPVVVLGITPEQHEISITPNPASRQLAVEGVVTTDWLSVFGMHGVKYETPIQHEGTLAIIDLSNLPEGVYALRIQREKSVQIVRFIKSGN